MLYWLGRSIVVGSLVSTPILIFIPTLRVVWGIVLVSHIILIDLSLGQLLDSLFFIFWVFVSVLRYILTLISIVIYLSWMRKRIDPFNIKNNLWGYILLQFRCSIRILFISLAIKPLSIIVLLRILYILHLWFILHSHLPSQFIYHIILSLLE